MSESLEKVERRYEATIARIEERLIEVQQERDALAAQIAATKQVVNYFADNIEPHVYGEISCELDDDLLDDDGAAIFDTALAKVKARAWDEGYERGVDVANGDSDDLITHTERTQHDRHPTDPA